MEMVQHLQSVKTLHNGIDMPYLGLGVYLMKEKKKAVNAIRYALQYGYRSIDTAKIYENEDVVGEAVKDSGIPREELFITTKVWNTDQGYDNTLKAFEESLNQLQMEYVDLYLIHWAVKDKYVDTWRALERLYDEKLVRAIGVCNFQIHHLEDLAVRSNEKPVVNQIELHPRLTQEPLREYCQEHDIAVEAWSPLARARLLEEPSLVALGKKYGKSSAQIILRWHLQNGNIIIPKSINSNRIRENAEIFDFELSLKDMNEINGLNLDERYGPHPDHFNFD
ncbi:diketogulonate reductase-like aldo/keto reductase [Bacillus thermophilus]|uniref:Diketogulonate reductase-like aldo/keto reductase n=2 Tax=Bacillaceae TaxID=186817 RepID=A0ABS2R8F0_9BACI|nr:diketogulonate reductase-like aldo/keto reductase [Siminovitchia thermophila]